MKTVYNIGVIVVCFWGLFSLFGCKEQHILDGPGMVRNVWNSFTISQSSDVYEQNFAYTVKYNDVSDEAILSLDVFDCEKGYPVEKSVRLKRETSEALFRYDLLSFPDATSSGLEADILDGTFLTVSVRDDTGLYVEKDIPEDIKQDILSLLRPYATALESE